MYNRQEASRIKQEFWTTFGRYMAPVPSYMEEPVNWLNYKTGEKFVFIRKEADKRKAYIGLEFHHPDPGIRALFFEQLQQLAKIIEATMGTGWIWENSYTNEEGKTMSRLYLELEGVSVFQKESWPELIRFFKQHMISLDEFWSQAKTTFETLR